MAVLSGSALTEALPVTFSAARTSLQITVYRVPVLYPAASRVMPDVANPVRT